MVVLWHHFLQSHREIGSIFHHGGKVSESADQGSINLHMTEVRQSWHNRQRLRWQGNG